MHHKHSETAPSRNLQFPEERGQNPRRGGKLFLFSISWFLITSDGKDRVSKPTFVPIDCGRFGCDGGNDDDDDDDDDVDANDAAADDDDDDDDDDGDDEGDGNEMKKLKKMKVTHKLIFSAFTEASWGLSTTRRANNNTTNNKQTNKEKYSK